MVLKLKARLAHLEHPAMSKNTARATKDCAISYMQAFRNLDFPNLASTLLHSRLAVWRRHGRMRSTATKGR